MIAAAPSIFIYLQGAPGRHDQLVDKLANIAY